MPTSNASYSIQMASKNVTPALAFNSSLNTVSFNVLSNTTSQIAVLVTVTGLSRPRECKNTSNFVIRTFRNGSFLMDNTSCCSLTLLNRQTLSINSI